MGVQGRVAVVTGGASGIGRGIAANLAKAGARVAILDIDSTAATEAANEITAQADGQHCVAVGTDLTDPSGVEDAIRHVQARHGSVDIVVNNAGVITGPTDIDELTEQDWDFVITTNTKSQYLVCQAAVPRMKENGFGRIINIASRSWLGVPGRAHYAASKGAVISFTRSLALELGPFGITANCISPTLVITPLFERTPDQDAVMERVRRQPIPRPGTSDDIAHAVLFFADDASDFITGQHIYVGGGADLMTATP